MGKSAKLHKRVKSKAPSASPNVAPSSSNGASQPRSSALAAAAASHKKRSAAVESHGTIKSKDKLKVASRAKSALEELRQEKGGHVLGGIDYVELAMGGRRKARMQEERMKRLKGATSASEGAATANLQSLSISE